MLHTEKTVYAMKLCTNNDMYTHIELLDFFLKGRGFQAESDFGWNWDDNVCQNNHACMHAYYTTHILVKFIRTDHVIKLMFEPVNCVIVVAPT